MSCTTAAAAHCSCCTACLYDLGASQEVGSSHAACTSARLTLALIATSDIGLRPHTHHSKMPLWSECGALALALPDQCCNMLTWDQACTRSRFKLQTGY